MTSHLFVDSRGGSRSFLFSFLSLAVGLFVFVSLNDNCDAQTFTNRTNLLSDTTCYSGAAIGVADMDGDGWDDIVRLDSADFLKIEYQRTPNNAFDSFVYGDLAGSGNEWSMCIADVDNNGYNDFVAGGAYNGIKLLTANSTGTDYTETVLPGSIFLQGSNLIDINNDGWLDLFACHDDDDSYSYRNQGDGTFVIDHGLIDTVMGSGNSGNYGSVWTDYDNDGDIDLYISKCRQGVSNPNDPRRINRMLQNDGSNNFTDVGPAAGLDMGDQSWAADFGDIDNDGDLDCFIVNHYTDSMLMRNNGDGTFTDITTAAGFSASDLDFFGIQVVFRDFDNDCFVDLLIGGSEQRYFKNNGDGTFSRITGLFGSNDMESFAIGDLNRDGYLDVYAGYANLFNSPSGTPDALWMNDGGTNNFINLQLKGVSTNISAVGARVELYGAWGKQIREVRAGESYGIVHSHCVHFGLGTATEIDRVVIRWPSGMIDVINKPSINTNMTLDEGATLPYEILVDSLEITAGRDQVFDLEDLDESDDIRASFAFRTSDSVPAFVFEVEGFCPTANPNQLDLTVESALAGKSKAARQRVAFYNFDSGQFEQLSTKTIIKSDRSSVVNGTGDLSRFVEPETGLVKAQISVDRVSSSRLAKLSTVLLKFDHIVWNVE